MTDFSEPPNPQHLATLIRGTSLYLVGLMGSGKSSTGRQLAAALDYRFFDTDQLIEQAAGQSIAQIFATEGEAAFRQLETQVLSQLSAYKRLVVATGGGIVTQQENWGYLRHGLVIWLDPTLETIVERLRADPAEIAQRPLLQSPDPVAALAELRDRRSAQYAQADLQVAIGPEQSPAQVVDQILVGIRGVLRPEVTGSTEN